MGAGGGGPNIAFPEWPEPSAAETALMKKQTDLLGLQQQYLQQQAATQQQLAPFVYQQYGLTPEFEQFDKPAMQSQLAELQKREKAQRAQVSAGTKAAPQGDRAAWEKTQADIAALKDKLEGRVQPGITGFKQGLRPGEVGADTLARFKELTGAGRSPSQAMQQLGLSSDQMQGLITGLNQERSLQALMGQIPLDPALQKDIEEGRAQTAEFLRKELGPGWQTSTPGIQTMDIFERRAADVTEQARRGQITNAQNLAVQSGGFQQNQQAGTFGNLMGSGGYPYNTNVLPLANAYQNPLSYYQGERSNQFGAQAAGAQFQLAQYNARPKSNWMGAVGEIGGQLAGTGLGLLAGRI